MAQKYILTEQFDLSDMVRQAIAKAEKECPGKKYAAHVSVEGLVMVVAVYADVPESKVH